MVRLCAAVAGLALLTGAAAQAAIMEVAIDLTSGSSIKVGGNTGGVGSPLQYDMAKVGSYLLNDVLVTQPNAAAPDSFASILQGLGFTDSSGGAGYQTYLNVTPTASTGTAFAARWSVGMGVCSSAGSGEGGSCNAAGSTYDGDQHEVDGKNSTEGLLISFADAPAGFEFRLLSATFGYRIDNGGTGYGTPGSDDDDVKISWTPGAGSSPSGTEYNLFGLGSANCSGGDQSGSGRYWDECTLDLEALGVNAYGVDFHFQATDADDSWKLQSVAWELVSTDEVPEPATLALLGFGVLGLGLTRRRRAQKR